jgi:hypothetical protein
MVLPKLPEEVALRFRRPDLTCLAPVSGGLYAAGPAVDFTSSASVRTRKISRPHHRRITNSVGMLKRTKKPAIAVMLWLLFVTTTKARMLPGNWKGTDPPCERHLELLKQEHMNLGIRFLTSDPHIEVAFTRAMNFWATVIDMEWHVENGQDCSIQIIAGDKKLFKPAQVARAQLPSRPAFRGGIALNTLLVLPEEKWYRIAVHELGHLLGLPHNLSARSVMFFLYLDGPLLLDTNDLAALAARHKLRAGRPSEHIARLISLSPARFATAPTAKRPPMNPMHGGSKLISEGMNPMQADDVPARASDKDRLTLSF